MKYRSLTAGLLMIALGCQKPADPSGAAPEPKSANGAHEPPAVKGDGKSKDPSAAFPPETWSIDDLAKYLNQKDVPVQVRPNPQNNLADRTAFNLYTGSETEPCVLVYHCRDASLAKDTAATLGADGFAAGRFAFGYLPGFQSAGSKQLLAKVKNETR